MAVFDDTERQFLRVLEGISSKVATTATLSGEKLARVILEVQDQVPEADSLLRNMDLEARTGDPSQRPSYLARLREHKIKLLALKKDFKNRGGTLPAARAAASAAGGSQPLSSVLDAESQVNDGLTQDGSGGSRDRLLSGNARLNATSGRLGDTRKMALQAEQLGVTILQDLHTQRQSLLHAHEVIHDVDGEISRSRHILRVMVAKMNRNKWFIGLIIFLLFAAIALVSYLKLK